MSHPASSYPIVLRVVQGYVEASQPDLGIYRVRGRFDDLKRRDEIGAVVLDVWSEIIERMKNPDAKAPSSPKEVLRSTQTDALSSGETAELLGVSIGTIRRMCDAGKLQAFRTMGGHWKIKVKDPTLARFLNPDSG